MTVVRAAITQTTWTGDKESMLDKHEQFARDAAKDGAQIICFQELFYGPYFGITEDKKYYRYAEPADGPIVQRFADARQRAEARDDPPDLRGGHHRRVLQHRGHRRVPTARSSASTASTTSRTSTGSGRSSTSAPATWATRSSTPRSARSACTSATTGTSRRAGASWASTARTWSSTRTPPSPACRNRLWEVEGPCAAVANGYFVLQPNRVGNEDNEYGDLAVDFYGTSQVIDPRGNFVGERGSGDRRGDPDPRPRHGHGAADARRLAVLPRPPAGVVHDRSRSRKPSIERWQPHSSRAAPSCRPPAAPRPTCSSTARRSSR